MSGSDINDAESRRLNVVERSVMPGRISSGHATKAHTTIPPLKAERARSYLSSALIVVPTPIEAALTPSSNEDDP